MFAYATFRRRLRHAATVVRRRRLLASCCWLLLLAAAHAVAIHAIEGLSLADAAWLTVTTLTTVGYGDLSAVSDAGRITTTVLLYGGGIFLLANTAGDFFDHRATIADRKRRGHWTWTMQHHIVIVGAPAHHPDTYFTRLLDQLRAHPDTADRPIVIVTDAWAEGVPPALADRDARLVHPGADALDRAATATAHAVVVLNPGPDVAHADAVVFDALARVAELVPATTPVVAECRDDANRPRFSAAGATTVIRPLRGYPELLARELAAPGSTAVLTDLFHAQGNECIRVPCAVRGRPWRDIAALALELRAGTPIGYAAGTGAPVVNPAPDAAVRADALYVIAEEPADPRLAEFARRCSDR